MFKYSPTVELICIIFLSALFAKICLQKHSIITVSINCFQEDFPNSDHTPSLLGIQATAGGHWLVRINLDTGQTIQKIFLSSIVKFRYSKVPTFCDAKILCCNLPKIHTKRPNLWVFCQNDAIGITKSED